MEALGLALLFLIQALTWLLFAYVIFTWILPPEHSVRMALSRFVEPLLAPIRQMMPQAGGMDFSPIVLFILLYILESLIRGSLL